MILESVRPFYARDVAFRVATERWEALAYHRLRRAIFCDEQRLFEVNDQDEIDQRATPIVAVARVAGIADEVVGVVRIWEEHPRLYWGGRLGVHVDHRRNGSIGAGLVRLAVRTAMARGCDRFLAAVQLPNVRLFERLRWKRVGEIESRGLPHALMQADLEHGAP